MESYDQIHGTLGLRDEANKTSVDQVWKDLVSSVKNLNFCWSMLGNHWEILKRGAMWSNVHIGERILVLATL